MITHDRYFLDRVSNRVIELDRGNLMLMKVIIQFFREERWKDNKEKESEDKRKIHLRKELKWIRRGAKARTTKQKARIQRFDELSKY